jgi:hypothetical protein
MNNNAATSSNASSAQTFPASVINEISLIQKHHPNIFEKISIMWGSIELQNYLDSIIFDKRGGRRGFSDSVGTAIFKVFETHGKLIHKKKTGDVWDVILGRLDNPNPH